jgi:tRNA threonylcarbamoyladenosine biosynthesis protein TsaB
VNVLAFDASTEILALSVMTDSASYSCVCDSGIKHAERLVPLIEAALGECGLSAGRLDLVVCAKGPGSFTGLRIAMATAKGLCAGSSAAMVSVPTLDYLAAPLAHSSGIVVPIIDARKGRVYAGLYYGGKLRGEYLDLSLAALLLRLENADDLVFTGPDADLAAEIALERPGWRIDELSRSPRPECLARIGKALFEERGPDGPGSSPLYIRESEEDLGITRPRDAAGAFHG